MTRSVLARALLFVAVAASAASAQTGRPVLSVSYRVIRNAAMGDTMNAGVVNANAVVYSARASQNFGPGGAYRVRWKGDAFGVVRNQMLRLTPPDDFQARFDADLGSRPVASTTLTNESLRSLPNFPGGASGTRPLIAASVPFEMIGANGAHADLVMFQRHIPGSATDSLEKNSRLFGTRGDTARVRIPANAWMPGDTLYVIETVGTTRTVTLAMALECAPGGEPRRTTCNPLSLGTPGATGYLPLANGYESVWKIPVAQH
jgi:hypothetical protein